MGPATVISGGSGANTAAGVASLGVKAAFIGKVKDDELGRLFAHDLRPSASTYDVPPRRGRPATARSFILVTPDGERTMNTYLGACQNLTPDDVDPHTVRAARIVYLEGYLWDPPAAKDAFRKAVTIAHEAGNAVALTLSDAFCVDRYRDEFLGLMRDGSLDILFANIHELQSLYQTGRRRTAPCGAARGEGARRRHPLGGGRARRHPRARRGPCRPFRSSASSTRPAPATSSPRASSPGFPATSTIPIAPASAASRPPRSSAHRGAAADEPRRARPAGRALA